jgi:hypothetical protein
MRSVVQVHVGPLPNPQLAGGFFPTWREAGQQTTLTRLGADFASNSSTSPGTHVDTIFTCRVQQEGNPDRCRRGPNQPCGWSGTAAQTSLWHSNTLAKIDDEAIAEVSEAEPSPTDGRTHWSRLRDRQSVDLTRLESSVPSFEAPRAGCERPWPTPWMSSSSRSDQSWVRRQ